MRGDRFSDAQIRQIKQALLRGAHPVALARLHKCSAMTIQRIKNGETYNHVEVEGEDDLRPATRWVGLEGYQAQPPQDTVEARRQIPLPRSMEEQERLEKEMLERLLQAQQEREVEAEASATTTGSVPQSMLDKAQEFCGKPVVAPKVDGGLTREDLGSDGFGGGV